MIVTFGGGLEERLQAKRAARSGGAHQTTVWEEHLQSRQAKKLAAKKAKTTVAQPADDMGFDDPFFSVGGGTAWAEPDKEDKEAPRERLRKRSLRKVAETAPADAATAAEEIRRRAELELMVMDDSRLRECALTSQAAAAPLYAARPSRKQARRAARAAKLAARDDDADVIGVAAAGLDVSDPRFQALFTRPEFALDPTDPRIKGIKSVDAIRAEAAVRRGVAAHNHGRTDLKEAFSSLVKRMQKTASRS
jgi:hypothetical protein